MVTVFVYGTLKPGEAAYRRYCQPQVVSAQPALVQGDLFHLPQGYPALTVGDRWIKGFRLQLQDDRAIATIDEFEDYDPSRLAAENLYVRQQLPIFSPTRHPLGTAWVYQMERQRIQALGGVVVTSGDWSRQQWPSLAPLELTDDVDREAR
ncbi:MAG: gamma-glutamylcyclotransferase [Cyanobacteria bacterium J06626_4]